MLKPAPTTDCIRCLATCPKCCCLPEEKRLEQAAAAIRVLKVTYLRLIWPEKEGE